MDNKITSVTISEPLINFRNDIIVIYSDVFKNNPVTTITLGSNVNFHSPTPAFEFNFDQFYVENGKQSGTYIYKMELGARVSRITRCMP